MVRPRLARLALAPALVTLGFFPACADDPPATTGGTTADTGGSTTGDGSTGAPTTGATTDDGTSTGDAVPALEYARGLRLTRVTANQAVQVEIVRDGLELPPEQYGARLIGGRKTVLRADWLLHADFTPRELIGRLTVWTPEGETRVDEFKTMVDGPSNDGDLFTTFSWELPASFVRPGLQYRIEALEPDVSLATGEVSDPPPVLPLPGRGTLVVDDAPMEIKVAIVPIAHTVDGMTCTPTVTEADLAAMQRALEQHNPVEQAILTLHEPMPYGKPIGTADDGFVSILTALGELRAKEMPPANLYYYGLIESCDGYPPGLLGQAYGIPDAPTEGFAFQRISTGRYLGSGAAAAETFVHEVGHCQGRYHIRCSGGEAGIDPAYPHSNGRIGVWGYGIHDTQMRSPTGFRDYMSYCSQSWVSDFGWELTFDTIKALTAWDMQAPGEGAGRPIVVGTLTPGGQAHWYTTRGAVPARTDDSVLEFAAGGVVQVEAAAVRAIPDSDAVMVVAALPDVGAIGQLTLKTGGTVRAQVDGAAIVRLE